MSIADLDMDFVVEATALINRQTEIMEKSVDAFDAIRRDKFLGVRITEVFRR